MTRPLCVSQSCHYTRVLIITYLLQLTWMTHPAILYPPGSKQTCMNRPNREELSLRMVLALPKASRIVLASRICCWTQVEMFAVTLK